jgi:hypothetical protein
VLRGVAANPSTPLPLLLRLAERPDLAHALLSRADLPPPVAERLSVRPEAEVRRRLVAHRSTVDRVRVALARDPDPRVRAEVACPTALWGEPALPTPAAVKAALAVDPEPAVRAALARNRLVPGSARAPLAGDPDPEVRRCAALCRLPTGVLYRLVGDTDRTVRRTALMTASLHAPAGTLPVSLAEPFLLEDDWYRRQAVSMVALTPALVERFRDERAALAANASLPPDLMPGFLDVAPALAENPALPGPMLDALVATMDPEVHRELLRRTDLPDRLRRRLLAADEDDEPLPAVPSLDPQRAGLEERLSYLDHPNPAFRRAVALSPDLPAAAVHTLAADPDWPTRLLVCERHGDVVPPEALAEAATTHPGHTRWDLLRNPRLPVGVAVRHLADAADDPLARQAVATRPDLPPDVLLRLLDDPEPGVRYSAAANPALPADRVRELLDGDDAALREAAAGNPALPVAELERLTASASGGPS